MLHIDGDIIAYRVACAVGEDSEGMAMGVCDSYVAGILIHFRELEHYQVYLSGETNFRDEVAVTAPYKGNRDRSTRPQHLKAVRQRLIDVWGAVVVEGIEADDAIATAVTEAARQGEEDIILSLDKDFDQVPGVRYNFVTKEYITIDPWEAVQNLYKQILTGDVTDNIIGADGIGAIGADDLIHGCTTELDMWLICVDQLGLIRAIENGWLVYLRRGLHDVFKAPSFDIDLMTWRCYK